MSNIRIFLSIIFACLLFSGCGNKSPLPDTSIIDELSSADIAKIIEYEKSHEPVFSDGDFSENYSELRESVDRLSNSEKYHFAPLTYRELGEACSYLNSQFANQDTLNFYADKYEDPSWANVKATTFDRAGFYRKAIFISVGYKYPLASEFFLVW